MRILLCTTDKIGSRVMTAYGCTYNPTTDFAVPKIEAPGGCYAHILAG